MNKALVIIDMQTGFETAHDEKTIENVLKQIDEAQENNLPIFILEHTIDKCGETLPEIQEYLDDYDNKYYIEKFEDDGGDELIECITENDYLIDEFITCGVNISYCVGKTINKLVKTYKKMITVIYDACNCTNDKDDAFDGCYCSFYYSDIFESDKVLIK